MKISELLGKPLISLADSCVEGILKDIIFDNGLKKAKYLVLFDDKNEAEEKVVPAKSVISFNYDALVIKHNDDAARRDSIVDRNNNPASKTVFNTEGKVMGRITDILLDEKLNVVSLELNKDSELSVKEIASFSDELLIIYDGKRIKIARSSPSPRAKDKEQRVSIQPVEYVFKGDTENNTVAQKVSAVSLDDDKEHSPLRIIGNYGFLLGRTVTSDIFNQRGDIIVNKETVITPETVENVRKYGRLVELTLHSLNI